MNVLKRKSLFEQSNSVVSPLPIELSVEVFRAYLDQFSDDEPVSVAMNTKAVADLGGLSVTYLREQVQRSDSIIGSVAMRKSGGLWIESLCVVDPLNDNAIPTYVPHFDRNSPFVSPSQLETYDFYIQQLHDSITAA